MLLADSQIREAQASGDIVIEPFDDGQIQAATYDLRVGSQAATTSSKKAVNVGENGFVTLAPGDFGIVTALETIELSPMIAARFGLRSKFARKGLIATTGPQIDPGYRGWLIVGLTNLTPRPTTLSYMDDFLSVEFHRLEKPSENPYSGPYQDRLRLGPEELEFITESEGLALSEMLTSLRSLSANVGVLTRDMTILKWTIPIIVTFGIAVIGIIVALD